MENNLPNAIKTFPARNKKHCATDRNFFSGSEIYFQGTKIYFQAFEIYFQGLEIVFIRGLMNLQANRKGFRLEAKHECFHKIICKSLG